MGPRLVSHRMSLTGFQSRFLLRVSDTFRSSVPSRLMRSEPTGRHVCGLLPFLKRVSLARPPAFQCVPAFHEARPGWKRQRFAMNSGDFRRPIFTAAFWMAASERFSAFRSSAFVPSA